MGWSVNQLGSVKLKVPFSILIVNNLVVKE